MGEKHDVCGSCFKLLTDTVNSQRLTHRATLEGQLIFHVVLRDLIESARRGCPLCNLFIPETPADVFGSEGDNGGGLHVRLMAYKEEERDCFITEPTLDFDLLRIGYDKDDFSGTRFAPTFYSPSASDRNVFVSARYQDVAARFISSRPLVEDPLSEDTLDLIRGCIKDCIHTHEHCPSLTMPCLPPRIIDVSQPTLVSIVSAVGQRGYYMTLSYCWGMAKQPVMLTKDSLSTGAVIIPTATLPQSIKDAIWLTSKLGMRYLWVDSLCIVQDDPTDKSEQISHMKDIFANAYITISAARAAACTDGFLARFEAYTRRDYRFNTEAMKDERPFVDFSIPYRCPDGTISRLLLQPDIRSHGSNEPSWQRAWTYEEHILSPRTIIFCRDAMIWECTGSRLHISGRHLNGWQDSLVREICLGNVQNLSAPEIQKRQHTWFGALANYTRRNLYSSSDRFRAIAGVAARFQPIFPECRYVAGLWQGKNSHGKDHMLYQLMWQESGYCRQGKPLPVDLLAPSWSWASVRSTIDWAGHYGSLEDATIEYPGAVVAYTFELVSMDPYGQVRNASLTLRGLSRSVLACTNFRTRTSGISYFANRLHFAGAENSTGYIEAYLDPCLHNLAVDGFPCGPFEDMSRGKHHGGLHQLSGIRFQITFLLLQDIAGLLLSRTKINQEYKRVGTFMIFGPGFSKSGSDADIKDSFFQGHVDTITII